MNRILAVFLGILFIFPSAFPTMAQQSIVSDSTFYATSVDQLYHHYFNRIGENAHLFNGSEYIRNGQKAGGFPFFESNNLSAGSVSYQGVIYSGLNLYYDLISDDLIIQNYPRTVLIRLSREKVDSFTLGGHTFLRIQSQGTGEASIEDGYYEQLSGQEPRLYAGRKKKLVVPSGTEDPKYVQYNRYYLKMNNRFYPVEGKNSLLDLLQDKKEALKKFIRSGRLNFRRKFEEAIVRTTTYYAQLKY